MKSTGHSAQCGDHTIVAGQQFKYDFVDNGTHIEARSGGDELHPNLWEYSYTADLKNEYSSRPSRLRFVLLENQKFGKPMRAL